MFSVIDEFITTILPIYIIEILSVITVEVEVQLAKANSTTIERCCYWLNQQQLSDEVINVIELNCTIKRFSQYKESGQAQTHLAVWIASEI